MKDLGRTILIRKPGQLPERIQIAPAGDILAQLQAIVGGYIEQYPFPFPDTFLIFHEEARLQENPAAVNLYASPYNPEIIGTIAIVGASKSDYAGLNEAQLRAAEEFFRIFAAE